MKKLWTSLVFLALPTLAAAQATVHGTVVDQQSGAPIIGASVVVTGTQNGTITNDAGAFAINATGAVASVTVSSVGYLTQTVGITDPSQALRVRLVPSATKLPGVQVVANKPIPSVGELTQADLQQANGLSLVNSINDLPGVFMQTRTPFGGARITIRGYYPSTSGNSPNSNGLGYQVFLNDIPITDATGTTILDDIDYSSLGNVEVIKGPASSQYGSYIGGAVRLTTARPIPGQTSFSQQVLSGTDQLLRTNTTFQTADDRSDVVVNYGHQGYNSFRPNSGSNKEYLRASGDFEVSNNQTVSAYFAYNRSFEELAGEIDSSDFYARDPLSNPAYLANNSHIQTTNFLAGVTDHYQISDQFTNVTTVFGGGLTYGQPFAHGFTDNNQVNVGARSVFGYATRLDNGVGINGTLGGTMQRSNVTTNGVFITPAPPYPERPTDQENYATNASLFTEWNFDFPAAVTLTVGGSLNANAFAIRNMLKSSQLYDTTTAQVRTFPTVFTPRVALTKGLGANASVYASVAAGYAPPLLSNTVANNGTVDLSLKPERAVQYEVGTQGSIFDRRLTGQVALFDLENTNKLVSETSNSVTFTTNAGKQRNRGAEVSLSYLAVSDATAPLSRLRPWISYSYTEATFVDFNSDNNNSASTVSFSGNAVPRVPKNMFNAGLDGETSAGFYFNGTFQDVGKVPITYDNSTWVKGYDLLGLKVGYKRQVDRHWLVNIFAGGTNLTNSTYYSFLFVGPNYAGLAQAKDGGGGDGYIIPAPYSAQYYANVTLSYIF
jgi:iron complex outermembrane recepter protein